MRPLRAASAATLSGTDRIGSYLGAIKDTQYSSGEHHNRLGTAPQLNQKREGTAATPSSWHISVQCVSESDPEDAGWHVDASLGAYDLPAFSPYSQSKGTPVSPGMNLTIPPRQAFHWSDAPAAALLYRMLLRQSAGSTSGRRAHRDPYSCCEEARHARYTNFDIFAFGLAHLTALPLVAKMMPTWMPFSGEFWSIANGIALMAAGVAILAEILDVIAARLLALMLFISRARIRTGCHC